MNQNLPMVDSAITVTQIKEMNVPKGSSIDTEPTRRQEIVKDKVADYLNGGCINIVRKAQDADIIGIQMGNHDQDSMK